MDRGEQGWIQEKRRVRKEGKNERKVIKGKDEYKGVCKMFNF